MVTKDRYIPNAYVFGEACSVCGQPADHAVAVPMAEEKYRGILWEDATITYFCDDCRVKRILALAK